MQVAMMRVFLAGASGVIGRRLMPLLIGAGHEVTGTTRSAATADDIARAGARAAVVDVFDAAALTAAVVMAKPDVVIHQLTDLPDVIDPAQMAAVLERNCRIRVEGTGNLVAAARAAGVTRMIAQSIAFLYAPGPEPHAETDPLKSDHDGDSVVTARGVRALERLVTTAGLDGIVLRYGRLNGPGTWEATRASTSAERGYVHVDAAAHAALLAMTRGTPGIYNIADDDGAVSIAKARRELGFDPTFRLSP
jgi:nucleoside-diphosphate-sugar epimerase